MYTSNLKLALHWLLITLAFYIFWCLSYLILVRFVQSQVSRFSYATGNVWSQITASDIFWYLMFVFGIAIVIFVIKKAMHYSPDPKIAAVVFAVLIIVSVGIITSKLLETYNIIDILPHLVINGAFLIPMVIRFFKKEDWYYDDEDEEQDYIESSI